MVTQADLDVVRERMKAEGLFDHEGYSGPAGAAGTVTIVPDPSTMRDRFWIIGAGDGNVWFDDVDSVIAYLKAHAERPSP